MAMMKMSDYGFKYAKENNYALRDVTLEIDRGELVLIAGDSGSGKSTFLKSLNGLIPHIVEGELTGERYIGDRRLEELPIYDISRRIGSVFQNPRSQFFTLNSLSELVFPMENYGFSREEMTDRLDQLQKELPISALMDRDILSLSSGERQLLALASAMVLSPEILLFDEPSANLDYRNMMELGRLMLKLKHFGKTILVADHRFFYLNNIVDKVLLIENNSVRVYNSEAEFKGSNYNTRSFELFKMKIPFKEVAESKVALAKLSNVSKTGILQDVSVELYKDEITTVIGINGAGKTTMARILTESCKPDGGSVTTCEMPFYVMQDADYQLFGTSVENEVRIGNKGIDEARVEAVLQRLGLWKYRDTHPFELSGGEKQRLQIAMAALSGSKLLIFDEPTSGLDVQSMNRTAFEIEGASKDRAVMIISHDYEFIRRISHRIIHLDNGRVAADFYLNQATVSMLDNIFKQMEANENEQNKA